MKRYRWLIGVAAGLAVCSALIYVAHYLIFHDADYILRFLVADLAFLPLQVLLAVVVIERMLSRREKRLMLQKMNMPIGLFFSELGVELLGQLTGCVENREELRPHLAIDATWTRGHYRRALSFVQAFEYRAETGRLDLHALRKLLASRHGLLLTLLANPNLLEHEEFTELLWAIFHLMEELSVRKSLDGLPQADLDHLSGDVVRAYSRLTSAWLHYCQHQQAAYPYIFSILVRTHPLQDHPDATVRA